jgi:hypothetical protein
MSDNGRHPPQDNLLDLYTDGLLSGPERLAFERRLELEPELRDALELQRRMDTSLRRTFVAPPAPQAPAPPAAAMPWLQRMRRSRLMAAAAVLLIALGAWRVFEFFRAQRHPELVQERYPDQRLVQLPMDKVYRVELDRGFKPQWICKDEREFVTTFWHKLGIGATLDPLPAGRQSLGLSFTPSVSPDTVGMLGRVDGAPVMLFVDRLDRDCAQTLSDGGLKLFRREVGALVIYEVTPLDRPSLMEHIRPRDVPEQWKTAPAPAGQGAGDSPWRKAAGGN